jgi:AcrR family transcriptional regulator
VARGQAAKAEGKTAASPSHRNLAGQRLGRKGRQTRERILEAAAALLAEPSETPFSLSAVAREASVVMTTLYLYFADLGELVLALLDRGHEDASSYFDLLSPRWPDAELSVHGNALLKAHLAHRLRHARLYHLREQLVANNDARFARSAIAGVRPLLLGLINQMDGDPNELTSPDFHRAVTLVSLIERNAYVISTPYYATMAEAAGVVRPHGSLARLIDDQIKAEGEVLALMIAEARARKASSR